MMRPDEFPSPFSDIFAELLTDGHLLYEGLRAQMSPPFCNKSLTIEIIDDVELDARAGPSDDGNYVIRFNRGALQHTYGTALGLCCCPGFLPSVGNAAGEVSPNLPDGRFPPIPLTDQDNDRNVLIPRDQVRGTVAHLLADIAVYFMLYHEIGHIVAGHSEVAVAAGGIPMISEYHVADRKDAGIPLSHAIECDADAFASHVSWNVLTAKPMADELRGLMQTGTWPPEDCAYICVLTAVSLLFRMLYPNAPATIGAAHGSHPHPAVRDFAVGCFVLGRGMARGQLSVEKVFEVVRESARNVEEMWADRCLAGQALPSRDTWAANVMQRADELFTTHAMHRKLFEKYSHLPRRWHDWEWSLSEP